MDAFYVSVELRRRPELRGLPVIVAGNGPRAVVTTASYEARRFGVGSAMPAAAGAAAVPRRRLPDARLRLLPRGLARGDGARPGVRAETVEVIGLDEAYLDLTGLPAPHAEMRRLALEIERDTRARLLDRDRAEQARRQGRLRRREAARLRRADARAGARAVRRSRAAAWSPGSAPRRPSGSRAAGSTRWASSRPRHRDRAGAAVRAAARRRAAAPGAVRGRAPVTEERKVISESRETTFDYDIAGLEALEPILADLVARLCDDAGAPAPARAHDRDQGAARRLLDPHARAHAGRAGGHRRPGRPGGAGAAAAVRAAAAGAAARRPGGRARARGGLRRSS